MERKARRRRRPGLVKSISERLRSRIQEHCGGNQSEFGRRVGVCHGTISGWLKPANPRAPDIDQLEAIAAKGRVNLNWLIAGEGEPLLLATTRNDDSVTHFRSTLVAELSARVGGHVQIVERSIPDPQKLLQMLIEEYQPDVQRRVSSQFIIAGVIPFARQRRGKKGVQNFQFYPPLPDTLTGS